jgi:hypothetical protein
MLVVDETALLAAVHEVTQKKSLSAQQKLTYIEALVADECDELEADESCDASVVQRLLDGDLAVLDKIQ